MLTSYTKYDILTNRIVLLPVDWDKNGLLFSKRLHITNKIMRYSHSESHYEQCIALWYTLNNFPYIKFLKSWTRGLECDKKIEKNYLDGLAFALVFLGAKHAGATVLHMQLWTLDSSFNVDLWLMNQWTKNVYFLEESW